MNRGRGARAGCLTRRRGAPLLRHRAQRGTKQNKTLLFGGAGALAQAYVKSNAHQRVVACLAQAAAPLLHLKQKRITLENVGGGATSVVMAYTLRHVGRAKISRHAHARIRGIYRTHGGARHGEQAALEHAAALARLRLMASASGIGT